MSELEAGRGSGGRLGIPQAVFGIVELLQRLAGVLLVAMMLLTCADVLGNVVSLPILGAEELVSLMAALLLAFVLPAAHKNRAHIGIDLVYRHLSPRLKQINDICINLISGFFFLLVAWQCWLYGLELQRTGEVSSTLQLPTYYILFAISVSCFVLFLTICIELLKRLQGQRNA